jgi:hypothetical protein
MKAEEIKRCAPTNRIARTPIAMTGFIFCVLLRWVIGKALAVVAE